MGNSVHVCNRSDCRCDFSFHELVERSIDRFLLVLGSHCRWNTGLMDCDLVQSYSLASSIKKARHRSTGIAMEPFVDSYVNLLMKSNGADIHIAYSSWVALVMCFLFLLTGGFSVFATGNWDTATFISAYL